MVVENKNIINREYNLSNNFFEKFAKIQKSI